MYVLGDINGSIKILEDASNNDPANSVITEAL